MWKDENKLFSKLQIVQSCRDKSLWVIIKATVTPEPGSGLRLANNHTLWPTSILNTFLRAIS